LDPLHTVPVLVGFFWQGSLTANTGISAAKWSLAIQHSYLMLKNADIDQHHLATLLNKCATLLHFSPLCPPSPLYYKNKALEMAHCLL
jgi:hypothetical protein